MARRLVIALGSSALVVAGLFACSSSSFEDLQLDAGYRFLPDSTADQDTPAADSGSLADGAPIDPTGADVDSGDEQPDSGRPPPGCISCDCDKDGFNRPNCGDGQGRDCDDNDPDIHPGIDFSEKASTDIDCSGTVEKKFASNVSCSGVVCPSSGGFTGAPACGQLSTYVTCKAVLIVGCQVDTTTQVKQACK